jgi:hypothetical protein
LDDVRVVDDASHGGASPDRATAPDSVQKPLTRTRGTPFCKRPDYIETTCRKGNVSNEFLVEGGLHGDRCSVCRIAVNCPLGCCICLAVFSATPRPRLGPHKPYWTPAEYSLWSPPCLSKSVSRSQTASTRPWLGHRNDGPPTNALTSLPFRGVNPLLLNLAGFKLKCPLESLHRTRPAAPLQAPATQPRTRYVATVSAGAPRNRWPLTSTEGIATRRRS